VDTIVGLRASRIKMPSLGAYGETTMADIKHSDMLYFKEFWDIV
jgi:hypothetical protein